jgi:hypothetical protein
MEVGHSSLENVVLGATLSILSWALAMSAVIKG